MAMVKMAFDRFFSRSVAASETSDFLVTFYGVGSDSDPSTIGTSYYLVPEYNLWQ
jgi:hypothetical protein